MLFCLPAPDWLITNGCFKPINVSSYFSITHMLIDVSSDYHNLKLDDKSSHLTTVSFPFGRYWYVRLPFGVVLVRYIFKTKIGGLFTCMLNVIGIADDILTAVFDECSKDHDKILEKVLQICRQTNLKLNKDPLLWWDSITARCESRPKQNPGANGHATEDNSKVWVKTKTKSKC